MLYGMTAIGLAFHIGGQLRHRAGEAVEVVHECRGICSNISTYTSWVFSCS